MTLHQRTNSHDDIAYGPNGRAANAPIVPGGTPNPLSVVDPAPTTFDPATGEVLESAPGMNALDTAKSYIQRGWNPTPIPFKSKIPPGEEWQKRVIDSSNVNKFFNSQPQNVGVIMGPTSGGLTDVDLDCPEAIAIAAFILPKTGAIFGRPSARMAHWLYRTDLARTAEKSSIRLRDPSRPIDGVTLVELRIGGDKGAQTVFPGSTHESGEAISWEDAGEPAEADGAELIKKVKLIGVGALLIRHWPGLGARHDAALAVGGFLARAGHKPEWIKYFVEIIARTAGCKNVADKKTAAFDSAISTLAGKKTYGLKTVRELFGEAVGNKIAEWLEYQNDQDAGQDVGHEATQAAFETSPVDPVDLWAKFDPPSLPRGMLPELIERYAASQGYAMGADTAGIAVAALTVCAAAIPDKVQLQVKRYNIGWLESARLWVALVGPPSTMKSPILSAAVRPLRTIDSEMARQNSEARARYDKLPADERKQVDPPKQTRLMLQDTTIEAAQEVIKDSPDGVLCYQDEMSGWFGSMDKYSGARGAAKDRAFWLEAFNGAPHSVHRVGRGSIHIPNLSACVLGGIQPEPIRKLADECMDDGLLQRLLPVILQPAVEGRDEPMSEEVMEYAKLIRTLHEMAPPATPLKFDDGAQKLRQELERKHLALLSCEALNKKLASHIGKYNGIFARLCVTFHCIDHAGERLPAYITEATARRAAGFLHAFLLPHALAFYSGTLGLADDHDRLAAVAGFILAHRLERITNRDVQRGDRTMRDLVKKDIDAVFDQLDALGWVTRVPAKRPTDPPHAIVNPAVHIKFADRAKTEAERRANTREMLAEVFGKR
jgi:Protein of unknown function (DUF3987)/Bifunctional DNA primase/polymerase, N-terminal